MEPFVTCVWPSTAASGVIEVHAEDSALNTQHLCYGNSVWTVLIWDTLSIGQGGGADTLRHCILRPCIFM